MTIENAVARLIAARAANGAADLLSAGGEITPAHGYDIQDALRAETIRRGEVPAGWKLAATGSAGQELFGIEEPIWGFLQPTVYRSGAEVSAASMINLHVEAEVAFRMGADLAGPGVTPADAARAVDRVLPAIEVPDLFFTSTPPVGDAIANSALAGAIVLGEGVPLGDPDALAAEEVVFTDDDAVVSTTRGDEIMGNPLNALAWLANQLATRGHGLKAGEIVMSGGISKLLRPEIGARIAADFSTLGSVSLTVTR